MQPVIAYVAPSGAPSHGRDSIVEVRVLRVARGEVEVNDIRRTTPSDGVGTHATRGVERIGPMRIAYLVSQYPAPSHTFIRREIDALRDAGIEVQTFGIRPPSPDEISTIDPDENAKTFHILAHTKRLAPAHLRALVRRPRRYLRTLSDAMRHRISGARAALWSLFYFAEAILLAEELERRNVVHLHSHFANSGGTVGYLASRHLTLPWSLTLHGSVDFDYPAGPLVPQKIEHAMFVACASHYVRSQAMRITPPELWAKLILVRCGVEAERCPVRDAGRSAKRVRILSVGRLSPEKGQLGLLQAFRAVLDAGIDAELELIGEGPLRGALEQCAVSLGLADRFRLLGQRSEADVLDAMRRADVFALSSLMEGLPVVLMEAMAIGVPVVAPAVAGIPELVEHERTGLLYPTGDFEALARALARIAADPELAERLSAPARTRVLEHLTMPPVAGPLIAELRSLYAPLEPASELADALAPEDSAAFDATSETTTEPTFGRFERLTPEEVAASAAPRS